MNKKRISKFVLGVGSVLPLVLITASCSTAIGGNQQIITPIEQPKMEQNLVFDYQNKSDVLAPLATLDNVIVPQLNNSDNKVVLKRIEWNPVEKNSITVYYVIEDKNSNIIVSEKKFKISGFKTQETSEGFPNVTVTYRDKSTTISTNAIDQNIVVNNLDESKYDFIIQNKRPNGNSLIIEYVIKDKKNQTQSDLQSITITGFQNHPEEKTESLQSVLNNVSFRYDNVKETPIDKVLWEKLIFSGIDLSKYSIEIIENRADENNLSISISFRVFKKGFESIRSDIKKVVISGFKPKSLTMLQLQQELTKITVEYPNKENVALLDAAINNVVFKGVDTSKVQLNSVEFIPNNLTLSALIKFKVQDINYPENLSVTKELEITGFAKNIISKEKIDEEIKKVVISYPNIENTPIGKVVQSNLQVSGFESTLYNFKINSFNIDDKLNLVVNLHIESLENPEIKSIEKTIVLDGFQRSELTNLIFGDSKGLLKLDPSQMTEIIKTLSEPKSQFVFDVINKKVFIPSGSEGIRISDPSSHKEVGILTELFINEGDAGWIKQVESVLGSNLAIVTPIRINIYDRVKTFLTSSKNEAQSTLRIIKILNRTVSMILNEKGTLDPKWLETLDYLLENNIFSIVYNPKTGQLVIGKGVIQVDFSDPTTFTPIIIFNDKIKNDIITKIRELLKATGINENVVDIMLGEKVTTLFTFEKSGTNVFSGIKLQQN